MLAAADRRSRALQDECNDRILEKDTTNMVGERREYYLSRQMLGLQDVRRDVQKRKAEDEAEANALVAADLAVALVTAAVAPVGAAAAVADGDDEVVNLFDRFTSAVNPFSSERVMMSRITVMGFFWRQCTRALKNICSFPLYTGSSKHDDIVKHVYAAECHAHLNCH